MRPLARHGLNKQRSAKRFRKSVGRTKGANLAPPPHAGRVSLLARRMPCYHPLPAFKTAGGGVVFDELRRHDITQSLDLPCGQCVGCRLERSRQWAIRCLHEAQLHKHNQFVTLTYADEHLPPAGLDHRDFQLFIKKLRKRERIRFYMCGEYGEDFARPHFHACIFNWQITDRVLFSEARGQKLYTSKTLDQLWGKGHATTGELTFESAAYTARYIMKKITGQLAPKHYEQINKQTGEITYKTSEYNHMSLKPGIGAGWIKKYYKDVYPEGKVVVRGIETKPPKYYDRIAKKHDECQYEETAWQREKEARLRSADNTNERLAVRETVAKAKIRHLKRGLA